MNLVKNRVIKEHPAEWTVSWTSSMGMPVLRLVKSKSEVQKLVEHLALSQVVPKITYRYPYLEVTVDIE